MWKCWHLMVEKLKGWSHKLETLHVETLGAILKKNKKTKKMWRQPFTRWPRPNKVLPCLNGAAWLKQCNLGLWRYLAQPRYLGNEGNLVKPRHLWKPRCLGFTRLHCLNQAVSRNRNTCWTKVPGFARSQKSCTVGQIFGNFRI